MTDNSGERSVWLSNELFDQLEWKRRVNKKEKQQQATEVLHKNIAWTHRCEIGKTKAPTGAKSSKGHKENILQV